MREARSESLSPVLGTSDNKGAGETVHVNDLDALLSGLNNHQRPIYVFALPRTVETEEPSDDYERPSLWSRLGDTIMRVGESGFYGGALIASSTILTAGLLVGARYSDELWQGGDGSETIEQIGKIGTVLTGAASSVGGTLVGAAGSAWSSIAQTWASMGTGV